jgi:hypothetical protein
VAVNIAAPQFVTFDFEGINRLSFNSTGGHFAMDNLTLNAEAVPEPSAALLVGMGMCCAAAGTRLRRRRMPSAGAV